MDDYYRARGWDIKTGIPTQDKLKQLDLGHVAEKLRGRELGRRPALAVDNLSRDILKAV